MIEQSRKIVSLMNQVRLDSFRPHLQRGGRYIVDLGSGDGRFAIQLVAKTRRWVLGIDQTHPTQDPYPFNFTEYSEATRFVYLAQTYRQLLDGWAAFDWLRGSVDQVFMIMPYPSRAFGEEVELIQRLLAPRGELHIRTEKPEIFARIKALFPGLLAEIPFAAAAKNISSSMTENMIRKSNVPLAEQGFKVL
jgi:hypothetical protein